MKWVMIVLATTVLAGCAHSPPAPAAPVPLADDPCRAGAVGDLVGRAYTPDLERSVRDRTRAATLRVIRPGDAVTMDYRPDRLNVELDARGRLARARCG